VKFACDEQENLVRLVSNRRKPATALLASGASLSLLFCSLARLLRDCNTQRCNTHRGIQAWCVTQASCTCVYHLLRVRSNRSTAGCQGYHRHSAPPSPYT